MNASPPMPTRARNQMIEMVRSSKGGFDADAWHVMDERDNQLIAEEVLHGAGSSKFVYQFAVKGTTVTGISVIGARHLASHYGGIKHRMVASIEKQGALFTFTSYPQPGMPMDVKCSVIPELEREGDFYGAIIEISDLKTGNTIQVERRENRYETTRAGASYERPHYATIAQSKAYRNGVLSLIDQAVQQEWKINMLRLGKDDVITGSVLDEKRSGVLRFAASKGVPIDRRAVEALTMDQIAGLGDVAREGDLNRFRTAAETLGLMHTAQSHATEQDKLSAPDAPAQRQAAPAQQTRQATQQRAAAPEPARQAPEPEPVFSAVLIDEFGEVVSPAIVDPVAFAEALASLLAHSTDRPTAMENNRAAMGRAADVSGAAADLLATLGMPDAVSAQAEPEVAKTANTAPQAATAASSDQKWLTKLMADFGAAKTYDELKALRGPAVMMKLGRLKETMAALVEEAEGVYAANEAALR